MNTVDDTNITITVITPAMNAEVEAEAALCLVVEEEEAITTDTAMAMVHAVEAPHHHFPLT